MLSHGTNAELKHKICWILVSSYMFFHFSSSSQGLLGILTNLLPNFVRRLKVVKNKFLKIAFSRFLLCVISQTSFANFIWKKVLQFNFFKGNLTNYFVFVQMKRLHYCAVTNRVLSFIDFVSIFTMFYGAFEWCGWYDSLGWRWLKLSENKRH